MRKIIIIGAARCGKTTLIEALSKLIEHNEIHLITLEEAIEKHLIAPHSNIEELPTFKIEPTQIHKSSVRVMYDHQSERVGKGGRSKKRSNFKYQSGKR